MNRSSVDSKSGFFQPMTLDVDEKIIDRNLKIVTDEAEDELGQLFPAIGQIRDTHQDRVSLLPEPDYPSVQVTPEAGMCVKTKNIAGEKVFVNICKIQEIPPAPPLSEEKLQEIILSEDYTADYKVPMSLGAPRKEEDKSGQPCLVCDVAINSFWYSDTMVNSLTFTTFVINLAMEGLCDKYGDQVNLDRQNWTILKNKKYMGTLQRHHIQQRPGLSKIQELNSGSSKMTPKPMIVEMNKSEETKKKPEFTIFKESRTNKLSARILLPGVVSGQEVELDVGEDRLILTSKHYLLDIFLPLRMDPTQTRARFIRNEQVLSLQISIVP